MYQCRGYVSGLIRNAHDDPVDIFMTTPALGEQSPQRSQDLVHPCPSAAATRAAALLADIAAAGRAHRDAAGEAERSVHRRLDVDLAAGSSASCGSCPWLGWRDLDGRRGPQTLSIGVGLEFRASILRRGL